MIAYFKVWFQMFLKHPGIYVQATMNNIYDYFYPGGIVSYRYSEGQSINNMDALNNSYAEENFNFHYNERTHTIRVIIEM